MQLEKYLKVNSTINNYQLEVYNDTNKLLLKKVMELKLNKFFNCNSWFIIANNKII